MTNAYTHALGLDVPALEDVKDHREASNYSLLLVALLERGRPMTLAAAAERFEAAGIAPAERALRSLQRCRPARPPIYRDGDEYKLDLHDDELELWLFRLGLRPPRVPRLQLVRDEPEPLRDPSQPLTRAELDEAWTSASLWGWSAQRLALAVLDAHGRAMIPEEVVAYVRERGTASLLSVASAKHWRGGAAVRVREDGRWEIAPEHDALVSARRAVRDRIAIVRRRAALQPDPAVIEANLQASREARSARAAKLARLRRVLVHVFPRDTPEAAVLVDVNERALEFFLADDLERARTRIESFDVIAALDVRGSLKGLGFDPGGKRLAGCGPPQKSKTLNKRGRKLKITSAMLIRDSCGISRPLGDADKLRAYLREGRITRLRRRLEADAKSLAAMYQYGRLHGALRLRWGFLDEMLLVPWVHLDEPRLGTLKREAHDRGLALEVVIGTAPGWADPWSRARRCRAKQAGGGYWCELVDERGYMVVDRDVQAARLVER